tara:strand:- start:108 stop:425 length:318 start_codon:yes stop_codon:yes gene_type:complete
MSPELKEQIEKEIKENRIMVYMKGNKMAPQCGFSGQVVHILNQLNAQYETKDVLLDDQLRDGIKAFSDWPTIPQVYIDGEFIGGCDIVTELFQSGQLEKQVNPSS